MFVSQNYMCFHANIFGWETYLTLKWKDITSLTKEKTALVIPNAILISTEKEKYFITSFASRDKAHFLLFRIWQNALLNKSMLANEVWKYVHDSYGEQLGLTSDDEEDYVDSNNMSSNEMNFIEENKMNKSSVMESDKSDKITSKMNDERHTINANGNSGTRMAQTKLRLRKKTDLCVSNDNLPTDLSNSSDSEADNVPFINTAECDSTHEGRQLVHTILPINVDNLMTLLFSKSSFFTEFHNMRKTQNIVFGDWIIGDDGIKRRTISMTVAVTQAIGPKTSHVRNLFAE